MTRTVEMKLLPGTRKVRIHWFQRMESAPATPGGAVKTAIGRVRLGGVKGKIACTPALPVTPQTVGSVIKLACHSDDPRAVTCPDCIATEAFKAAMQEISELLQQPRRRQKKET